MTAQAPPGEVAIARPVAPSERIQVVDVLRGFAMFGILVVNLEGFSSAGYRDAAGDRIWPGMADRFRGAADLLLGRGQVRHPVLALVRPGARRYFHAFKQLVKRLIGRREVNLYDLAGWTVFGKRSG